MNPLVRGYCSILRSTPTVTPTGLRSRRMDTQCSLLRGETIRLRPAPSTTSTCRNVRTSTIRGVTLSTSTPSIARPASEACRPFERVARKFVGWAIGQTAMATWTSIARNAVSALASSRERQRGLISFRVLSNRFQSLFARASKVIFAKSCLVGPFGNC